LKRALVTLRVVPDELLCPYSERRSPDREIVDTQRPSTALTMVDGWLAGSHASAELLLGPAPSLPHLRHEDSRRRAIEQSRDDSRPLRAV
jgi:hypothetical protein